MRATRRASYNAGAVAGSRDYVVRALLATCNGTLAVNVSVAKSIVDVVENDLAE
jgi:hypothetical protein